MQIELRAQYWPDTTARRAFEKFVLEVHGLDFSAWQQAGFWDDAYTPFSFFVGDTIVASVCVYLLDAVVDNQPTRLAQISAVGTLPEYRRRGLNRELTEIALDWARGRHHGVFLFSNPGAVDFYEKCGFTQIDEFLETTEIEPVGEKSGRRRLDPGRKEDLDRIHARAKRRCPVSGKFAVLNDRLLMFHALYNLRDCAYEIPDLDCVIFYRRDNGTLDVYDVVAESMPRWEALYPYIASAGDSGINFHFHTDRLGLRSSGVRPLAGNYPFVTEPFPVDNPVFPFTSRA